jgi:mRNA-degrading endonuclease RelE of RelBE toxin-antitoxin system
LPVVQNNHAAGPDNCEFLVFTTSRFDRELKKLVAHHSELPERYRDIIAALRQDPHNRSRRYLIKKLQGAQADDGQYRIRSGRFRFRYDIDAQAVYLKACSLRREDSY